jgi:hypothetical protein
MDIEALRSLLSDQCVKAGSQRAWATKHKISPAHVNDVLQGHRGPGPTILEALGLKRVVDFVPRKGNGKS